MSRTKVKPMPRPVFLEDESGQIGKPCGTCAFHTDHLIGAGVALCQMNHGYQFPDKRLFDCKEHEPREHVEGLLRVLEQAIIWNRIAREWATGTNVGTPDDPRHASLSPKALKAHTEAVNARHAAFMMAWGTGL